MNASIRLIFAKGAAKVLWKENQQRLLPIILLVWLRVCACMGERGMFFGGRGDRGRRTQVDSREWVRVSSCNGADCHWPHSPLLGVHTGDNLHGLITSLPETCFGEVCDSQQVLITSSDWGHSGTHFLSPFQSFCVHFHSSHFSLGCLAPFFWLYTYSQCLLFTILFSLKLCLLLIMYSSNSQTKYHPLVIAVSSIISYSLFGFSSYACTQFFLNVNFSVIAQLNIPTLLLYESLMICSISTSHFCNL